MKKFPPELIQKIRDNVNILEVVGEHVVLRKTGSNYMGLCPFHSERSASFSVSEQKQLYHCYGCNKGGDLFSFVMEIHGVSFPEAVDELAERARVALPKDLVQEGGLSAEERARREAQREKLSTAYKLNRFVAAFYHQNLAKMPDHLKYFENRGVGAEWQRNFYLGSSQPTWDSLTRFLIEKKAPLPLAVELGLIKPSTKTGGKAAEGPGYFDLFRNRVIFPILNLRGKVAGFGGRIMPQADGTKSESDGPKYLNSAESPLFHKSKLAYGLYQAQKHIREKDEVILVEGYFDVLALHAAGFQNVVASCGTALTVDHLQLFKRFASKVTILFDGDKAGIAATERAMELGLQNGEVLAGAVMPVGLDPDEVLFDQNTGAPQPQGVERMREILAGARPLLDVRMEQSIKESQLSTEARTQAIKQMAHWLAEFTDPVGREVRVDWLTTQMGITRELLNHARPQKSTQGGAMPRVAAQIGAPKGKIILNPPGQSPQKMGGKTVKKQPTRLAAGEKILLSGLARGGESVRAFIDAMPKLPANMTLGDLFDYVPAQQWVREIEQNTPLGKSFQVSREVLTQPGFDAQVRSILTEAWMGGETPFSIRDFQLALDRAIGRLWARFSQQIKTALAEAEAKKDAGLQSKLMKEYLDVQRRMKEFSNFYDEA